MLEELATQTTSRALDRDETFVARHIGPRQSDQRAMLALLGYEALDQLIDRTVPRDIRVSSPIEIDTPRTEAEVLAELRGMASENRILRTFIGCGYYNTYTPPVIQRNILENPGWYTQYTPYQAEISQGRLEALLNFQTMVTDLTGLPLANGSLLDEATSAAEAMGMCRNAARSESARFLVASDVHPQTLGVVRTRAVALGIEVVTVSPADLVRELDAGAFGVLVQYPATDGRLADPSTLISRAHELGALAVVATDLLALCCLRAPGEMGADIAVGSAQRFGVPLGYGGPHAAFLTAREDLKRVIPGRIAGVSKDTKGRAALRLALQTREQHIRRDKATSNICTAQVLLAIMAGMYAVFHGPEGLLRIAKRTHRLTALLAAGMKRLGYSVPAGPFFDTLRIVAPQQVLRVAEQHGFNLRPFDADSVGISFDETTTETDVENVLAVFASVAGRRVDFSVADLSREARDLGSFGAFERTSTYLEHEIFHRYRSEHELLRYIHRLQTRDLSLTTSMIPLGSCTMKLNGTAEMAAVTWPEFGGIHPFAPSDQVAGYRHLLSDLEHWLGQVTGFPSVSLQPNSGAQGEYAGLLVIRAFHQSRGHHDRNVCLIPDSAHGTNPASAVMAGFRVVAVRCDKLGSIDVEDLKAKAAQHASHLAALMVTYPSTHGVFEESIKTVCDIVHEHGGQVYMDGANMNAQVGLCRPGDIGADVCHLNLHKTFCIPHGGGGPGMGPICCAPHLAPFLPGHPFFRAGVSATSAALEAGSAASSFGFAVRPEDCGAMDVPGHAIGPVSAAPFGSPSILVIPWAYIRLMGGGGLAEATKYAILNANYMAKRLEQAYPIVYKGQHGHVAHEFIMDLRPFKASADVGVDDVAKRLMDYGFHAPTMSWPVPGTLMVEPTESESKEELDRFCDAMLAIRREIEDIEQGRADRADNALKNAPHTMHDVTSNEWSHAYAREHAAFPLPHLREHKFWPPVNRVDNAFGDRNLICTCPPMETYSEG